MQMRDWAFDLEEGLLDPGRLERIVVSPDHGLSFRMEKASAFRDSVVTWPDRYRAMVTVLKKGKLELQTGEGLKRLPRDYDSVTDPDQVAAVKLKHFYVREAIDPARIHSHDLVDDCVAFMKRAMPLIDWGRESEAHSDPSNPVVFRSVIIT